MAGRLEPRLSETAVDGMDALSTRPHRQVTLGLLGIKSK
jgi:hypothetical protein